MRARVRVPRVLLLAADRRRGARGGGEKGEGRVRIIEEREGRRSGGGRKTLCLSEARKASSRKNAEGKDTASEKRVRGLSSREKRSPRRSNLYESEEDEEEEKRRGVELAPTRSAKRQSNGKVEAGVGVGTGAETGGSELTV